MAWAHGTAEPPERFAGPMIAGAAEARLYPDCAMSEPLQRVLRAKGAADPRRRADGLPAVALLPISRVLRTGRAAAAALSPSSPTKRRCGRWPRPSRCSRPKSRCSRCPAGIAFLTIAPPLRCGSWRSGWRPSSARRCKHDKPQLLIATASAATQRMLTPFRIRQLTRRIAEGERIEREALVEQLNALGYQRDRYRRRARRICGPRIADRPVPGRRGTGAAPRLLRRRDRQPPPLRSDRPAFDRQGGGVHADAGVGSACSMRTASSASARATARSSAATATQDPLYQALSEGRRMAGMEHWLPLLEERLATLFDHLGEDDLVVRDAAADQAVEGRREAIDDYYQNRVRAMEAQPGNYRPLEPHALYLSQEGMGGASRPTGQSTSLRPSTSRNRSGSSISESMPRAISRRSGRSRPTSMRRWQSMSPTCAGAVTRSFLQATRAARASGLTGLLEDHGLKAQKLADNWQEALGSKTQPALLVLPLDHGFTTPEVAVLTEQDMLGDRLVRRRKKRKAAARLPRGAGDPLARRPCGPCRSRNRPLRGADPNSGQQGAARLRRARICARRQTLCSGREYRAC